MGGRDGAFYSDMKCPDKFFIKGVYNGELFKQMMPLAKIEKAYCCTTPFIKNQVCQSIKWKNNCNRNPYKDCIQNFRVSCPSDYFIQSIAGTVGKGFGSALVAALNNNE